MGQVSQLCLSAKPKCSFKELVLPSEVYYSLMDLIDDQDFVEVLSKEGIPVRRTLFLHGPTGCGKTSIAHALADALGIKLFIVSLSQTINSHVGDSEKKIDELFNFAATNRIVLLIDEFDSIATSRQHADSSAVLSGNRVVNTILTKMDQTTPLGIIVACSNFYDEIDKAVLRRFDMELEIPAASQESMRMIAEKIINGRFGIKASDVMARASTPAAVVKLSYNMLRMKVIELERSKRAETLPLFDKQNPAQSIIKNIKSNETKKLTPQEMVK